MLIIKDLCIFYMNNYKLYLLNKMNFRYDLKRKFSEGPISWEMACQCERQKCDDAESMLFTAWSLLISRLRLMPRDAFGRWRGTIAQWFCVYCGYWPVNNFIKWQNCSECFSFFFLGLSELKVRQFSHEFEEIKPSFSFFQY